MSAHMNIVSCLQEEGQIWCLQENRLLKTIASNEHEIATLKDWDNFLLTEL